MDLEQASVCDQNTPYNLYPPAVCEKNQILSLLMEGAYYFKNLHQHCFWSKEKPLQNNCSLWNPFYLLVDLEGAAMDPAHYLVVHVVLVIDDNNLLFAKFPLKNLGLLHVSDL